jgi:GNAT superfamily N-acetyltransferase
MITPWRPEMLSEEHELGAFDCGNPLLNQWLTAQARRAQDADTARTYVWAEQEGAVVAYYSIAPTQVYRDELPRGMAGGYSVVPAYLLGKFALDRTLQRQGRGADLLVDALSTIVQASETGAGRLIVVDAIDENAAGFYRKHDFKPIADTNRLVMKVSTARTALGIGYLRFTPSPDAALGSMVLQLPNGTTIPTVVSTSELEAIMGRFRELAQRGDPDTEIDLNQVLVEVLGRDPLSDRD